ncbi:MAG TPA: extracellular solute-binding protein [Hyphomicrobiaceae bacterium]|nr:extracellular solute-binding protein [Hyphomicrobiaceae bacterium]
MTQSRLRTLTAALVLTLGTTTAMQPAFAQGQPERRHAVSLVAPPKMKPDFKAFDWVRPDAPKGGVLKQAEIGTFDSFNAFPTAQGNPADGLGLIYDRLFVTTPDEASAAYGLVAAWISYPDDFSSATFGLRPEARFHDGKPITPEDVIFSFEAQTRANQNIKSYYKHVTAVEKTGAHEVTFRFDSKGNRELPQIVSELQILPKHWWEGKRDNGEARDITKSSLELPLGSGPYRVKSFEAGRKVVYERVKDWWAKDLPVAVGQYNFDELHFEYFGDRLPAFGAFKTGQIDVWRENSAKAWAIDFDFDAIKSGRVKKETIPVARVAGMQAFMLNLRRPQFQDARVRQALNYAFDYEWANKNLFYEQYTRLQSYFDNSELASRDLPTGLELDILNSVKSDVPPEVFTTVWKNPVTDGTGEDRRGLMEASKLLRAAGLTRKDGALVDAKGNTIGFEFLLASPTWDRIVQPYMRKLEQLGFKVTSRQVDPAQYKNRLDKFDFDVIVGGFGQSESPGNEQRAYFGSAAADVPGTRNVGGVKNKAIDAIIERIVFAKSRDELVAATRALDRVLLWNHYVVPHWHMPADRIAYWTRFGRPEKLTSRGIDIARTWWADPTQSPPATKQ